MSTYILQEFVTVKAGEPFRLLPFGVIHRLGKAIDFTKELAGKMKLPHYSPPVKLGSHDSTTPAGGHIESLEVREDGLYAHVSLNEQGAKAFERGDFKYHSPEVMWKGAMEDATTGQKIKAPMILGDALLHSPALGEQAALYCVEKVDKETSESSLDKDKNKNMEVSNMSDNKMEVVELSALEKLFDKFKTSKESDEDTVSTDTLTAVEQERDQFKAALDKLEAEKAEVELLASMKQEFSTDEFGAAFTELGEEEENAKMLASMEAEQRAWVLTKLKALSAQIKEGNLTTSIGSGDNGATPSSKALNDKVLAYQAEHKVEYDVALSAVIEEDQEFAAQSLEVKN